MQKKLLIAFASLLSLTSCVGYRNDYYGARPVYVFPGIGLGTLIAVVVS